jgi:phage host-nuclease inhibitor protein Gam
MAKRASKAVVSKEYTPAEMEKMVEEYAITESKIAVITTKMEADMAKIREKNSTQLVTLGEQQSALFDTIQLYYDGKRELFEKEKSLDFVHATLGFRKSPPAVKTLKGFTWDAVTNLLKEFLPAYVRVKEEPNKELLLSEKDALLLVKGKKKSDVTISSLFEKCGIQVVQGESFFIKTKNEDK